ncbi:unnamed protein product [Strongylus vulgaris]|uniref:Uncharacterized protein n=1 Tax=Strongylus vulgaris TaxID=40348 RepID=A0A3P7J546_STRVU|nr:unnamed protein product [Strongylus vulgaris]
MMFITLAGVTIITTGMSTPFSIWAFKDNRESVSEALKLDSSLELDASFIITGGPTIYLWLGALAIGSSAAFIGATIIIKHTSIILKDHAKFSQTSRDMHRKAIIGLIIQTIAVFSSTIVPMFMLCHMILIPPSSLAFLTHYGTCATLLFSVKSFNASVSMICTTVPYR